MANKRLGSGGGSPPAAGDASLSLAGRRRRAADHSVNNGEPGKLSELRKARIESLVSQAASVGPQVGKWLEAMLLFGEPFSESIRCKEKQPGAQPAPKKRRRPQGVRPAT